MPTLAILVLCASALSQVAYAAPAAVAIDLGSVTEEIPRADAPQLITLHREQHTSDDTDKPVNLWINDFGNIEAIPTTRPQQPTGTSLSSGKTARVREAAGSDGQAVQPAARAVSVSEFLDDHYRAGTFDQSYVSTLLSGGTRMVIGGASGAFVLSALVYILLRSSKRSHRIRRGHRRGLSRYSE